MPTSDGGEQRQQRHQVVAQPSPDEQRHRAAEDGEGQDLLRGHGGFGPVGDGNARRGSGSAPSLAPARSRL